MNIVDKETDEYARLAYMIYQIRRCLYRVTELGLLKYDVTPEQDGVFRAISLMNNAATFAEITHLLIREPHTISTIIKRMEKKGLLTLSRSGKSKTVVSMTELGKETYLNASKVQSNKRIISQLSSEKRKIIEPILRELLDISLKELRTYHDPF